MKKFAVLFLMLLAASLVVAHPHFRMSITATLAGDVEPKFLFTPFRPT